MPLNQRQLELPGSTMAFNMVPPICIGSLAAIVEPRNAFKLYDYDGTGTVSYSNMRKVAS